MPSLARTAVLAALSAVCLMAPAPALGATLLRLDGIGPLTLGMSRVDAVHTGWLSDRAPGCELGGPPLPITYRLDGAAAPRALAGSVQFEHGRLTNVSVTRSARTAVGVVVGRTSARGMVRRYRAAGFSASSVFVDTFGGTFVRVKRAKRWVIGGFATGGKVRTLGIPSVLACE